MSWENSASSYEASETGESIKGAFKENLETRPHNPASKIQAPWKSALIGALFGFILFAIMIAIMSFLFGRLY
jgi:hypothetical protein